MRCRVGCTCGRHSRPDVTVRCLGVPLAEEIKARMSLGQATRWEEHRQRNGQSWRSYVDGSHHFVYSLLDPNTHEVRWVGESVDPWKRFLNHCTVPSTNNAHWKWIESLRPARPTLRVLCIVATRVEAERVEVLLSRRLRTLYPLLNILAGQHKFLYRVDKEES